MAAVPPDVIKASVGEEITVRLAAAPSAGYGWELDPLPEGVTLVGREFDTPARDQPPGAPLQQVFRLRAETAGVHSLTFRYKRPWESNALQTKTVSLVVR